MRIPLLLTVCQGPPLTREKCAAKPDIAHPAGQRLTWSPLRHTVFRESLSPEVPFGAPSPRQPFLDEGAHTDVHAGKMPMHIKINTLFFKKVRGI